MNDIIVLKQLPIIEEHLHRLKAEIEKTVERSLSMPCTEETVKEVKAELAKLRKDYGDYEERRKEVKNQILAPYENFNTVYEECVKQPYESAIGQIAGKVKTIEGDLKKAREISVRAYFDELAKKKGLDFVEFERAGISVGLSGSMKSYKEKAEEFLCSIEDGVSLIGTQPAELRSEIMVEFKSSLNAAQAVKAVAERHEAMKEEAARSEDAQKSIEIQKERAEKVAKVLEKKPAEQEVPKEVFRTTFTVIGTIEELKALKEFLEKGGYTYEQ